MKALIAVILFSAFHMAAHAQGFRPPSEGKAVIYFTRISGLGFAIGFDFFHEKQYIGDFAGRNYMRYECAPGEHLFWASSENTEFLTAEVRAGETYVVIVDVLMGVGAARVGLTPVTSHDRDFERAKKLIDKKSPVARAVEEIKSRNVSLTEFIEKETAEYSISPKDENRYRHLSPGMAIPLASM